MIPGEFESLMRILVNSYMEKIMQEQPSLLKKHGLAG